MSTYTDLHNNIKETINVDYRTRATNQQVKLLNEQNEYWGTFRGQMEVEGNSVISGAQLNDVVINNAVLCGVIQGGGLDELDITEITNNITQLKTDLDEEVNNRSKNYQTLQNSINDLAKKIEDVKLSATGDTSKLEEKLTSKIAETSANLNERITSVDTRLSLSILTETSARISADIETNKALSSHTDRIDILFSRDNELNELALSVDNNSIARHEDALQKLAEHNENNEQRFLAEHNEMLSTVEKDRHYEIVGANVITASYPYKLKDFAVNTIDTNVQGYVLSCSDGLIDANVKKNDDDTITISFYNNINPLRKAYYAVQPGQVCVNLKSGIAVDTGRNNYQIMYTKDGNAVKLTQKDDRYLEIKDRRNDNTIGKVRQVQSTDEYSCQILSGIFDINTSDSTFKIFNKFTSDVISQTLSTVVRDNEKIVLNSDLSTLSFYTGVHDVKYMDVKDVNTNEVFALIIEDDVIREDANIKSVTVTADGKKVALTEDNSFTTEYRRDGDDHLYTLKLSDDILINYETHAKYGFDVLEKDTTPESRSQVRILQENVKDVTGLTSDVEYCISNTQYAPFNGKSCICKHDSFDKKWHGKIEDDENHENFVNITIDIANKLVDIDGIAESVAFTGTYGIKSTPCIYNDKDAYKEVNKSAELDLINGFDQLMEAYEQMFSMYAFRPSSYATYGDVTYSISRTDSSKVNVVFPERKFVNKSCEFILRINVNSDASDTVVAFEDDQKLGKQIIGIDDNELSIKCNRWQTYRIFEVENGKFAVEDIFNESLSANVQQNFTAVNELISKLQTISADHQLSISNALSGIDEINDQLSSTLRYQGMISVDNSITSFAHLLFKQYKVGSVPDDDTQNIPLYPGYFWIVDAISNDYKIEDVKVGKNDRIYINGKDPVVISAVTSARVDVEDVYDSDTVHEWQLNDAISSFAKCSADISNALCEASCILSSDDRYLSSQISGKVSIGTYDSTASSYAFEQKDLSIVTISDDIYYALKKEGKLVDGIIYNMSSDFVNAHNDRVISVRDPEVSSDAANKKYVDDISTTLNTSITAAQSDITANKNDIAYLANVSANTTSALEELSTRYDNALSTVEVCHHKDDGECETLSVEQLILTDENKPSTDDKKDKYRLTFKYGTLVLVNMGE